MKAKNLIIPVLAILTSCSGLKDGDYQIHILSTNDVHGTWFDSTYVSSRTRPSLIAVKHYADSIRNIHGRENVVMIDAGDCLQGDNAAYYFNYTDTVTPHLYPRLASWMGYDAVAVGNHDIETGHRVYDRVARDLNAAGIAFLAGNAVRDDNGKPYFPLYTILRKGGLKVAVIGYTNANIKAWLTPELWSGMSFNPIISQVQNDVDAVKAKEKPDVTIVAVHSGTGNGDGSMAESEGLDVFRSVKGVDFVLCSHDHRPYIENIGSSCLINAGSHSRYLGHGVLKIKVYGGKVVSKVIEAENIPVSKNAGDSLMRAEFQKDYNAVKAFTLKEVGELKSDLRTRDSFKGMCDYINFIHAVSLSGSQAEISFAAPLTFNGFIKAGTLVYNDLFTIYPFENQLFVVRMSGAEIKSYLEHSYDQWINTIGKPGERLLQIVSKDDPRTGQKGWSFVNRSYNFDSAAGLVYNVDVTREAGARVNIISLADGKPFDMEAEYKVAMTSYRASGGGGLMKMAGIDTDNIDERVVERRPEIRNIIYQYLSEKKVIDPAVTGDPSLIGHWEFVPKSLAEPALNTDMALLFRK